jgi:hypothetical protein
MLSEAKHPYYYHCHWNLRDKNKVFLVALRFIAAINALT